MPSRLKNYYEEAVVPALMENFKYKNRHQVPGLRKIVVNMGLGEAIQNPKAIDGALEEIALITGQRPIQRRARKSIASFKLREGMPIGCMVTLRRENMYQFFDKLVSVALPRVRDFRGVNPRGFDGRGNFSMGIKEQIIFPEIDYDKIDALRGLDVCITTTARSNEEGRALLEGFRFPFKN